MLAGRLRSRVILQAQGFAQNEVGENVAAWYNVKAVWAGVEPVRGREYFAAIQGQSQQITDTRFNMRFIPGINQSMRVIWQAIPFQIQSVIDVDGRGRELELLTRRGAAEDYTQSDGFYNATTFQQYAASRSYFASDYAQ